MSVDLPATAFFVSISSDIACFVALKLLERGVKVGGTYRTDSENVRKLIARGAILYKLDCTSKKSIEVLLSDENVGIDWEMLMISPVTMNPINRFDLCSWDEWEESFKLNSLRQFQIIHSMIGRRHRGGKPTSPLVYLWSGPGTNNAPLYYSAEISAKIAQIKMCELLDKEFEDIRFVIVGPGWVNTKTHKQTIDAKNAAGANYQRTLEILNSGETTPLSKIYEFFCWAWIQEKKVVSGRNFSIRGDIWGSPLLEERLRISDDSLKLRRYDNDWSPDNLKLSFLPKGK
jgi:NAD(P)-dependent dehydrogenase (short-subunit alcohol dehydrogenase family)